jgi:hypothetical protein
MAPFSLSWALSCWFWRWRQGVQDGGAGTWLFDWLHGQFSTKEVLVFGRSFKEEFGRSFGETERLLLTEWQQPMLLEQTVAATIH